MTSARVEPGVWGAAHARLHVTDGGGEIEYDCAHGTLTEPLELDGQGHFSVSGTHVHKGPGPIRVGFMPAPQRAIFSGSVVGQTMTLTVTLPDEQANVGKFTLLQGSEGRLWKCK